MKIRTGLLLAVLSFGAHAALTDVSAATLKAGGTGAVTKLLHQLAPAFEAETGIVLEVAPPAHTGSRGRAVPTPG